MDLIHLQIFPNFEELLAVIRVLQMNVESFFLREALVAISTSEHGHLQRILLSQVSVFLLINDQFFMDVRLCLAQLAPRVPAEFRVEVQCSSIFQKFPAVFRVGKMFLQLRAF